MKEKLSVVVLMFLVIFAIQRFSSPVGNSSTTATRAVDAGAVDAGAVDASTAATSAADPVTRPEQTSETETSESQHSDQPLSDEERIAASEAARGIRVTHAYGYTFRFEPYAYKEMSSLTIIPPQGEPFELVELSIIWQFFPEPDAEVASDTAVHSDLTGNGIPDLLIIANSGGAACCNYHLIFELGETLQRVEMPAALLDAPFHFVQTPDGSWLIITNDTSFTFIFDCSRASSPGTLAVLAYRDGAFRFAGTEHVELYAARLQERWGLPLSQDTPQLVAETSDHCELADIALDLLYAGYTEAALEVMRTRYTGTYNIENAIEELLQRSSWIRD